MRPYIQAGTILAALLAISVMLPSCSIAALQQTQSLEGRMTALEGRVHALEMQQMGPRS